MSNKQIEFLNSKAKELRLNIFNKFLQVKQGHPGSIFSILDATVALFYGGIIRSDNKKLIDKFVMSKGHATSVVYPIYAELGYLNKEEWDNWGKDKSNLRVFGNTSISGIEVTTGSLGIGLGVAAGLALSNLRDGIDENIYVVVSEGEFYEGSVWETLLFINHYKLYNLKLILDINNLIILGKTSDCLDLGNLPSKIEQFGFETMLINGHSMVDLMDSLTKMKESKKLQCLCLNTIKGKGISFMENDPKWHYWNPVSESQITLARKELSD
tara:strand:+ start:5411 stop:6220 length:810 start_codon:yes stop_codon:yes gene_type:complete